MSRIRRPTAKSGMGSPALREPATQIVEVAAGLVFRNGRLLITQRRPTDHLGGLWEFPGGKREGEESFEACLERELAEELGIEVCVGKQVATVIHQYPEKKVHLKFFKCSWSRHEPRAIGCDAFAWVEMEHLAAYKFPPADCQLISRLQTSPGLWR